MQLFQINQSKESSKNTINAHTTSGRLHQRSITSSVHYNRIYSILRSNILFVTAVPCCRERGLLAEGAKFLVSSLEVDLALLEAADTGRDLRSFYFFPLLRPGHPDTAELATRRGCGDQCRCRLRDPRL